MTQLNGNSGSSFDDISERRLVAFKRARVWFWTLLAAPTAVALIATVLVFSSNQIYSGLGSFIEAFILLETLIIIPFLIHALYARIIIRRSWRQPIHVLFGVWGGTIALIFPFTAVPGINFPSFGEVWYDIIFNYDTYSRLGEHQDIIIMMIMIPIGVASNACGYFLGFGLGLIAERLIVGKDQ